MNNQKNNGKREDSVIDLSHFSSERQKQSPHQIEKQLPLQPKEKLKKIWIDIAKMKEREKIYILIIVITFILTIILLASLLKNKRQAEFIQNAPPAEDILYDSI